MSARSKMLGLGRRVDRVAVPIAFWRDRYRCPLCGYTGHFLNDWVPTGIRPNATCPSCGGHERHRIQWAVMDRLADTYDFGSMAMLHLAPESALARRFRAEFGEYTTAEYDGKHADLRVDLTHTDLPDESFEVVYASHVLEHIPDDLAAGRTVRRLLRPGGFAILPVPIVCEKTVDTRDPSPPSTTTCGGPDPTTSIASTSSSTSSSSPPPTSTRRSSRGCTRIGRATRPRRPPTARRAAGLAIRTSFR